MKYLQEFQECSGAEKLLGEIRQTIEKMKRAGKQKFPVRIMEICGGQTHSILREGIDTILAPDIEFIHGPGCPVCVTPAGKINLAIAFAKKPGIIFASFGDMLRVPGSGENMFASRAQGADIREMYSPLDAVETAKNEPKKEVVFFAIGFETTTAPIASALFSAEEENVKNFSLLTAMVKVPPALELLLSDPRCEIDGVLAAGNVCSIMGYEEYIPLAEKYGVPITVTGFQTSEILLGVLSTVKQLYDGRAEVENAYDWVVRRKGNLGAQRLIHKYLETVDRHWRGIGMIPKSGFGLRKEYFRFDAEKRFAGLPEFTELTPNRYCGAVLQGKLKPCDCPFFGKECTRKHPIGALMVSGEGACAAYGLYKKTAM